jgi:integrase
MKGKVKFDARMKRWYVSWYLASERKSKKFWFYKGDPCDSKRLADKLLSAMQDATEKGIFCVETFTKRETDVVPYLRAWLETIRPTITPGTYKDYRNSIENHLVPFFADRDLDLSEIQYDVLMQLLSSIRREGKGKLNVMYCLRACLDYAWRSNRIHFIPPFPKRKDYQIVEPSIKWLSSEDQATILNVIPIDHQPVFWWLKYHLRRPGEAMALRKEDYQGGVFTVHRGFSAKEEVDRTKTGEVHLVPAVSEFLPFIDIEQRKQTAHGIISPYMFVHPGGKQDGRHYTHTTLNAIWHEACKVAGIDIDLYSGLKHSTASQMINESGYSVHDVQAAGDWSRLESVKKYAKTETTRVKQLLERKVIRLGTISASKEGK